MGCATGRASSSSWYLTVTRAVARVVAPPASHGASNTREAFAKAGESRALGSARAASPPAVATADAPSTAWEVAGASGGTSGSTGGVGAASRGGPDAGSGRAAAIAAISASARARATMPGACGNGARQQGHTADAPPTKLVSAQEMWNTCLHGPVKVASVGDMASRQMAQLSAEAGEGPDPAAPAALRLEPDSYFIPVTTREYKRL